MSAPPQRSPSEVTRMVTATEELPALGEDHFTIIPEHELLLRRGTSLALIAKATQLIQSTDLFRRTDPTQDWQKYQQRGASLFYSVLEQRDETPVCALRAIIEAGECTPFRVHPARLIIDYVQTANAHQGKGYATLLSQRIINMARALGANVYVVALEEAVLYWTQRAMGEDGFLLEEDQTLNDELNCFSDTYLLKANFNVKENLVRMDEEEEEDDDAVDGNDGDDDADADDDAGDNDDDDDDGLQRALQASLRER